MKQRILFLAKQYVTLLTIFVVQKVVFMLVNIGHADGATFLSCAASLWHGLRLDSPAACYLLVVPLLATIASCFFRRFRLRRWLLWYYIVAALLMAVTFIADTVLYYFWGAKMDANDLMYAAKPRDTLASLALWSICLAVAAVVLVTWLYYRSLKLVTPKELRPLRHRWHAVWMLLAAGALFVGMRGGVSESTANPSYAYFSQHPFCNHAALNPLFNMMHSLAKVEDLDNEFSYMPRQEAADLVEPCFATSDAVTDTLLANPRPNILMVIWESAGSDMVLNDSVAPNLMRLSRDGVLFGNCHANNFRTDRGLVSLLNGWLGMPTTSLMKMPDKCRALPGLASTLGLYSYTARFFYGGDIDFTNMRGYLLETGFTSAEGSERFAGSRRKSSWGAPDAYTMLPSVVCNTPDTPFFHVLLTLSSHEPWEVPMRRLADDRQNAFAYTDSCLGVLVDSLKALPLWDNLLLIIVSDHGVPLSSRQSTSDYRVAHIPMLWTGGAVRRAHSIDAMMMQSDLAATLLAQMGISHADFPLSRNVLAPDYPDRYHFAFHAFKNGCNLIDSAGVTRYDCTSGLSTAVQGDGCHEERTRFIQALLQYTYQYSSKL